MSRYKKRDGRPKDEVKADLLEALKQGTTVTAALKELGRSVSWYEAERRADPEWAALATEIRTAASDTTAREKLDLDFPEFSERFLFQKVHAHGLNMVSVMSNSQPAWLHPSMTFEWGARRHERVLINIPPNHAKSTTMTVNYVTWRLMMNPNLRVLIISKTQDMARKFLYSIKTRLTHPRYAGMQLAYGPNGGWKSSATEWSQTKIYLERDDGEKDPSVEALGIGGMVYGARADLVIIDDAVTLSNSGEWTKQQDWIRQEVATRLGPEGQLLVVGTRVSPVDLYRELRNPDHYADGVVPWTYLSMPAVLEYAEDPDNWVTLWPRSEEPLSEADKPDEEGLYRRWDGERLQQLRNEIGPSKWALVYQQQDVEENAVFPQLAVYGSVHKVRRCGPLVPDMAGVPSDLSGMVTVCAMDPAIAGTTAVVALSIDRNTGHRWILDVQEIANPTPAQIRGLIENFSETYHPTKFVIETNAFQGFLAQDEDLLRYMAGQGIALIPHQTNRNKTDEDMGVAAMAPLFGSMKSDVPGQPTLVHAKDNTIHIPNTRLAGPKSLVEQLIVWSPTVKKTRRRDDAVMALWMAVYHSQDYVQNSQRRRFASFAENEFLSARDRKRQVVINLADYADQSQAIGW